MKLPFVALLCFTFSVTCFSKEIFEGTYSLTFKNTNGHISKLSISVKDSLVHLKNIEGGNPKYSHYIIDYRTGELTTVSQPDKKVAIVYPLYKLLELYERNKLKDGYKVNSETAYKPSGQLKEEYGIKMTKYTAEDKTEKTSFWHSESPFDFNQLIPFLRMIDGWNSAQMPKGTIWETEVTNKGSKNMSTVVLTFKKEFIADKIFEVPQDYLRKDFVKLIEGEKMNKQLNTIIKAFTEF